MFVLVGRVFTNVNHTHNVTEAGIVAANPYVHSGGTWQPTNCRARHRVAVIIPYRDREHHLIILLAHLHPMLQRQQLHYTIFVVEQVSTSKCSFILEALFVLSDDRCPSAEASPCHSRHQYDRHYYNFLFSQCLNCIETSL